MGQIKNKQRRIFEATPCKKYRSNEKEINFLIKIRKLAIIIRIYKVYQFLMKLKILGEGRKKMKRKKVLNLFLFNCENNITKKRERKFEE